MSKVSGLVLLVIVSSCSASIFSKIAEDPSQETSLNSEPVEPAPRNPEVSCEYKDDEEDGYTCHLFINNPDGENFTQINGDHLGRMTNADVRYVQLADGSLTVTLPNIVCDSFSYAETLRLTGNFIRLITRDTFQNCFMLSSLHLRDNKIQTIDAGAFDSNEFLRVLDLGQNFVRNLPGDLLRPLKRLEVLYLNNNFLPVIHSDLFYTHPQLRFIEFSGNRIEALSPVIFKAQSLRNLKFENNQCASVIFENEEIAKMKEGLKPCIDNYENLEGSTEVPAGCSPRDVPQRVCTLEDSFKEKASKIAELTKKIEELEKKVGGN